MKLQMIFVMRRRIKLPVAMRATVLRFLMIPHVTYQRLFSFETSVTRAYAALELSLVTVSGQVALQRELCGETLIANQTHVHSFSRVLSLVVGEVRLRSVSFTANGTLVGFFPIRFVVNVHVLLESAFAGKIQITHEAFERLFVDFSRTITT